MLQIKVSVLVSKVNNFLSSHVKLDNALVQGELSNVKYINGHCYFDLKDEQGQISCTLWKSNAAKLGFRLEDGMAVLVHGKLNVYEKRGQLQLSVDHVQQDGIGALAIELEKRRQYFDRLGYFNPAIKKPRPIEINRIAVVTGRTTAALQDVLKTVRNRWPMLRVHLFEAPVQGVDAPPRIAAALQEADMAGMDAVLLVRGGGSFEDRFCFNDPVIVEALHNMKTYTVTGIGHEIDSSLADFTADHYAFTPTAAAQWVTPDQNEVRSRLQSAQEQLIKAITHQFETNAQRLMYLQSNPLLASPMDFVRTRQNRLDLISVHLQNLSTQRFATTRSALEKNTSLLEKEMRDIQSLNARQIQSAHNALLLHSPLSDIQYQKAQIEAREKEFIRSVQYLQSSYKARLEKNMQLMDSLNPEQILKRGYSIVTLNGKPVKDAGMLAVDDRISIRFDSGRAFANVLSTGTDETK
ncbi:MAG: exodeoxyribonuclease VII large subunit [Allobaculum sp.]